MLHHGPVEAEGDAPTCPMVIRRTVAGEAVVGTFDKAITPVDDDDLSLGRATALKLGRRTQPGSSVVGLVPLPRPSAHERPLRRFERRGLRSCQGASRVRSSP